jgi:DNA-directed RNA polymerase subunit M/transcription elongation factor TFIIS
VLISIANKGETVENFVPVFESKVKKLRDKIVKELSIPKKNRNKKRLKKMLDEIRSLKKTIKSAKKIKTCPHCGNPLWEEESP